MRLHLDSLLGTAVVLLGLQGLFALGADDPGPKPELVPVVDNSPAPMNVQTDAIGQLAEVAKRLSEAVFLVGHPETGYGTAFVISRAAKMQRQYAEGRISLQQIRQRMMSWAGHAQQADTYRLRSELFRKIVFQRATTDKPCVAGRVVQQSTDERPLRQPQQEPTREP